MTGSGTVLLALLPLAPSCRSVLLAARAPAPANRPVSHRSLVLHSILLPANTADPQRSDDVMHPCWVRCCPHCEMRTCASCSAPLWVCFASCCLFCPSFPATRLLVCWVGLSRLFRGFFDSGSLGSSLGSPMPRLPFWLFARILSSSSSTSSCATGYCSAIAVIGGIRSERLLTLLDSSLSSVPISFIIFCRYSSSRSHTVAASCVRSSCVMSASSVEPPTTRQQQPAQTASTHASMRR